MNLKIIYSVVLSTVLHIFLLFSFEKSLNESKVNYSHKKGIAQIKATFQIYQREEKITEKRVESQLSEEKIKEKATQKKKTLEHEISKGNESSGDKELIAQYLSKVRDLISNNKVKTRIATRLNLKGRIRLNFTIEAPGTIMNVKITESSGKAQLDQSALKTVMSITHIPTIPSKVTLKSIPVSLVISYE